MALINLTSGANIFSLDENNIVRAYVSGDSVRVEYVETDSVRKTIFVSESMETLATAAKNLIQVTDTVIGAVLINSDYIISVRTEGSGAVIRYDSGDTLRRFSVSETKSEVEALFPTPPVPFVLPYQVYTALLTQSGDGTDTQTSGTLVIGRRYAITTFEAGDDFSNIANVVSGTINEGGCEFIATGTTPTTWTEESVLTDTSAPVATILGENTIGNIVWSRVGAGSYRGTLIGAFPFNKTISPQFPCLAFESNATFIPISSNGNPQLGWINIYHGIDFIEIGTYDMTGGAELSTILGSSFLVEIRVYS